MRRTSSGRSISLHPGQNGRRSKVVSKFQSQNVQIYGYVFHDTSDPNLGQASKTQSFFLNETCVNVKRRLRNSCSVYWTRIVCFSDDSCKSNGRHCETPWLCRTSRRRSICDTSDRNPGQAVKTQWFLLNEICADIHLQASCGEDNLRRFYWDLEGNRFRIGNVCLFIENNDYSCRYPWMTSKWLEETRKWLQCGRNWWNLWIKMNQYHFSTMYIWNALNVNVNRTKTLLLKREKCSNHEFLLPQLKIDQDGRNFTQKLSRGPTTWNDMRKSAKWGIVNWQSRVGDLSDVCSQIDLKCLYLARFGRLDILWSVNKLARAVTKWTRACDRLLARLIPYFLSHEWLSTLLSCG